MDFEKKYWSNGEFELSNGEKYVGYVGIYNGDAYIFDTEEILVASETFTSKVNLSEKFFDRTLAHKLELPYKKEDVIFAANDFLHAGTVKTIVERLQENNMYLFRNAIIPNSILPINNSISLFATDTVNKYFFSYIDMDGNVQMADENGVFDKGKIYTTVDGSQMYLGEAAYIINESYAGSIMEEKRYEGHDLIRSETGEELYNKFYKVKNIKFSRIPKITAVNDMHSGKLKRYSFSSSGLNSKTHFDPYFYPQREFKEYMSVKTIVGTWEDNLSKNVVLTENKDRDPSADKFTTSEHLDAKSIYNLINDIDIDIDIDTPDTGDGNISEEQLAAIKENLTNINAAYEAAKENSLYQSIKYYDKLSGEYEEVIAWDNSDKNNDDGSGTIKLTEDEFKDLMDIEKSIKSSEKRIKNAYKMEITKPTLK
jgi:hypothetical protein